jgi:hypothetical protein
METKCTECQAIAAEMRVALAEITRRPTDPSASREDLHNFLNKLFSSEAEIARLATSFRDSHSGRAYARWTEHRIATGHSVAGVSWSMN